MLSGFRLQIYFPSGCYQSTAVGFSPLPYFLFHSMRLLRVSTTATVTVYKQVNDFHS